MTAAVPTDHRPGDALLRVLVADDIADSRAALAALVRAEGHQVIEVDSGAAALAAFDGPRETQPDLVLLDLLMPDLDGFAVTRALRQRVDARWLPVIVTSSLQGEAHFIHALSEGADDCLSRPVTPELLSAKLRHYQRVLGLQARLAELALRQRQIHDHVADAILTLDAQGRIVELNRAAQRLLVPGSTGVGQPVAQALGVPLDALVDGGEIPLPPAPGGPDQGDSPPLVCDVAVAPWQLAGQDYITLRLHDLTERRRVERMKDEFLATVSHELRTPLTSVLGALGLLSAGAAGALPAPAQELIGVARRNGERLSRLIDDVLDLTKLEGNRMVLNLRSTPLAELLREAMAANEGYAQRAGALLALDLRAPAARARVDADRLLQVMANLLSNALKHSRAGQTVTVRLAGDAGGWRIDVADQGPGIAPAFRARLFDKFAQADGSDWRAQGGTGLGLYITRMLVERMGGRIGAESVPGQGATFSVWLPPAPEQGEPWLLVLVRDARDAARLGDWLAPVLGGARLHSAHSLAEAQALVEHDGPPAVLLADPQSQGPADAFCAGLRRLAQPARVLLLGDAIDAGFAGRAGLAWLAPGEAGGRSERQRLCAHVTPLLEGSR